HGDNAVLIDDLVEELDLAGAALARTLGERAAAHIEPVARPDRPLPSDFLDSSLLGDRRAREERVAIHPEQQRARMPAGGDEAAGQDARGLFVNMEGLRIEVAGEGDDLVGR